MNSSFQIPGRIQQQQQQQEQHHNLMAAADENSCTPVLLSMNQTQILQHIHNLPLTQQFFLEQQHFLPQHHHHHQQQSRLHHHYVTGSTGDSSAFFPVNFKLGLNEICSSNDNKVSTVSNINQGEDTFLRGSKQYEEEDTGTRHSSLKLPNCWQNQQDSAIKQTPFWEPLIGEAYENSETVHERQQMNQKEDVTNCLESKSRQLYGELEAIYKRLGTEECNQTDPSDFPVNAHLPTRLTDRGSDASIGKEASEPMKHSKRKRSKKKKNNQSTYNEIINPMTQFFENLVKQVMDHQENLHKKFNEVIERLDEERRERDEAWRNQELTHFQQEAAATAQEKALAAKREAAIVSYLEKISGQRINLPSFDPTELTSTNTTDDFPVNKVGSSFCMVIIKFTSIMTCTAGVAGGRKRGPDTHYDEKSSSYGEKAAQKLRAFSFMRVCNV